MKKVILIFFTVFVLMLTSCGEKPNSQTPDSNESNTAGVLSSFEADTLSGDKVDQTVLNDYGLTMVNVWATFCGPCIREMPDLGELADEYKTKGVQILGIVSDVFNYDGSISQSQIDTANDIVKTTNADYTHIIPSDNLLELVSQFSSVPTTFFVDKNGNQVGEVYVGSRSKNDWQIIINDTLELI